MKNRSMLLLGLICLGGMAYPVVLHRTPWLVADETMYARAAWNLAHRRLLVPDVPGAMNYPPLYAAVLAPASLLPDIRMAYAGYQFINVMLWLMGGLLAWSIAQRTGTQVPAWMVAAAALAVPAAAVYVPLVMSENLALVLLQCTAFCLFRASTGGALPWILAGWSSALASPFCRATGLIVPVAFLVALTPRRWISSKLVRWAVPCMAALAVALLIILPTSALKVYHPLGTAAVAAKTLAGPKGWGILARNTGTILSLITVGSAGLLWLLVGGPEEERPIRRFLAAVIVGQAFVTVAYMQYGSAGPRAETYRTIGRYVDPGLAVAIPWLLSLTHRPRRLHAIMIAAAVALAVVSWPREGFKPGQVLAFAGLGLASVPFRSVLGVVPVRLAVLVIAAVPVTAMCALRGRWRPLPVGISIVLLVAMSHDALAHAVAMSRQREVTEWQLWRLNRAVGRDATLVVERPNLTPEMWTALYTGLFWLPSAEVRTVDQRLGETAGPSPTVLLTAEWRPDRLLHAASHMWYLLGESRPPVERTVSFYDLGSRATALFSASPADGGGARWSGETCVIEFLAAPCDWRITIGLNPDSLFGSATARASLNGHPMGQFTSADTLVSFSAPSTYMRPDGRQLLDLRVSPNDMKSGEDVWRHGVRLDWVALSPAGEPCGTW